MDTRVVLADGRARAAIERAAITYLEAERGVVGSHGQSEPFAEPHRIDMFLALTGENLARVAALSQMNPLQVLIALHHLNLPWLMGRLASMDLLATTSMLVRRTDQGSPPPRGGPSGQMRLVVSTLESDASLAQLLWSEPAGVATIDLQPSISKNRVHAAFEIVIGASGSLPVKAIASALGVSRRHLDAEFSRHGLPTLASLLRAVRRAVTRRLSRDARGVPEIASRTGQSKRTVPRALRHNRKR